MFRGNLCGAILGSCEYVTAAASNTGGAATSMAVSLAGMAAGDLAIIGVTSAAAANIPAGWSGTASTAWSGKVTRFLYKVLEAADITAGSVTVNGISSTTTVIAAAYRGPTGLSLKSNASGSAATLVVPGFSRSSNSMGVVAMLWDGDEVAFTSPSKVTERLNATAGGYRVCLADIRFADNYDEGSLTWSGFTTSQAQAGFLLELTQ